MNTKINYTFKMTCGSCLNFITFLNRLVPQRTDFIACRKVKHFLPLLVSKVFVKIHRCFLRQ